MKKCRVNIWLHLKPDISSPVYVQYNIPIGQPLVAAVISKLPPAASGVRLAIFVHDSPLCNAQSDNELCRSAPLSEDYVVCEEDREKYFEATSFLKVSVWSSIMPRTEGRVFKRKLDSEDNQEAVRREVERTAAREGRRAPTFYRTVVLKIGVSLHSQLLETRAAECLWPGENCMSVFLHNTPNCRDHSRETHHCRGTLIPRGDPLEPRHSGAHFEIADPVVRLLVWNKMTMSKTISYVTHTVPVGDMIYASLVQRGNDCSFSMEHKEPPAQSGKTPPEPAHAPSGPSALPPKPKILTERSFFPQVRGVTMEEAPQSLVADDSHDGLKVHLYPMKGSTSVKHDWEKESKRLAREIKAARGELEIKIKELSACQEAFSANREELASVKNELAIERARPDQVKCQKCQLK